MEHPGQARSGQSARPDTLTPRRRRSAHSDQVYRWIRAKAQGRPVEKFPNVVGVLVPYQVKEYLREMLERAYGLTRMAMYPDFAGLGESHSLDPHK